MSMGFSMSDLESIELTEEDLNEIEREVENMDPNKLEDELRSWEQLKGEFINYINFNIQLNEEKKREINSRALDIKRVQPPFSIGKVHEVVTLDGKDEIETDETYGKVTDGFILHSGSRDAVFFKGTGLPSKLEPNDTIIMHKDSYIPYKVIPPFYDKRVKCMEIDERPTDTYENCGGIEKQIQELREAVILPITKPELFEKVGITPPKGALLYGPPGTGKTLLARAAANESKCTFLRLSATQLVKSYAGEGAKMIRDFFKLAKEKGPTIIFIDEIDAIGTIRSDEGSSKEVGRTMTELLNALDGFTPLTNVKVICATNRPSALDPALLRSGRLDRKIELPMPNEDARESILRIHSKKMKVSSNVNFRELARSTDQFNGAQVRAVCVEAGMNALRTKKKEVDHEDFTTGISVVLSKKKEFYNYIS